MNIEATRQNRNMPWLKRGMGVDVDGRKGRIVGGDGNYIRVRFEGLTGTWSAHPWHETTYYDAHGNVIADYKGTQGTGKRMEE